MSTYPEPRDVFIEDQHDVNPDGKIGAQIANSAGVWVPLEPGYIVEWLRPEE